MTEQSTSQIAPLDSSWSVNDVIRSFPETVGVFNEFGVDSCCGGDASLEMAALDAGTEAESLITALVAAIAEERAGR